MPSSWLRGASWGLSTCSAHVQEGYMLLKQGQFLCWRQDARQYGLLVVSLCTMTCMHLLRVQSVYVWEDNTAFCICRKTPLFQNTASAGQESTPTAVPSAPFQGLNRAFARAAKPHSSMSITDPQGQSPVNGLLSVEATISEIYLTFSQLSFAVDLCAWVASALSLSGRLKDPFNTFYARNYMCPSQ